MPNMAEGRGGTVCFLLSQADHGGILNSCNQHAQSIHFTVRYVYQESTVFPEYAHLPARFFQYAKKMGLIYVMFCMSAVSLR